MHSVIMFFNTVPLATPTPSPTPSLKDGLTTDQVSPGFLGFLATFFIVVIMVFLIVDMVRRIRRVRYRAQVAGDLAGPVIPEDHDPTGSAAPTDEPVLGKPRDGNPEAS